MGALAAGAKSVQTPVLLCGFAAVLLLAVVRRQWPLAGRVTLVAVAARRHLAGRRADDVRRRVGRPRGRAPAPGWGTWSARMVPALADGVQGGDAVAAPVVGSVVVGRVAAAAAAPPARAALVRPAAGRPAGAALRRHRASRASSAPSSPPTPGAARSSSSSAPTRSGSSGPPPASSWPPTGFGSDGVAGRSPGPACSRLPSGAVVTALVASWAGCRVARSCCGARCPSRRRRPRGLAQRPRPAARLGGAHARPDRGRDCVVATRGRGAVRWPPERGRHPAPCRRHARRARRGAGRGRAGRDRARRRQWSTRARGGPTSRTVVDRNPARSRLLVSPTLREAAAVVRRSGSARRRRRHQPRLPADRGRARPQHLRPPRLRRGRPDRAPHRGVRLGLRPGVAGAGAAGHGRLRADAVLGPARGWPSSAPSSSSPRRSGRPRPGPGGSAGCWQTGQPGPVSPELSTVGEVLLDRDGIVLVRLRPPARLRLSTTSRRRPSPLSAADRHVGAAEPGVEALRGHLRRRQATSRSALRARPAGWWRARGPASSRRSRGTTGRRGRWSRAR